MSKSLRTIMLISFLVALLGTNCYASSCNTIQLPSTSSPGGDHPDETFAVDSGFINPN